MSSDKDAARERIALWLRETMAMKGWPAEAWARRAGVAGTNITRFLNGKSSFLPSATTLIKLAAAADVHPPLTNLKVIQLYVSCLTSNDLRTLNIEGKITSRQLDHLLKIAKRKIPVEPKFGKCVAFVLDLPSLSLDGLPAGSTVIVDLQARPITGQKVVALVGGKLGAFLYHPPFLMTRTTDIMPPVNMETALLIGVARGAVVEF